MTDVVSDQVEVSYAESVTGWSGDSFTLEPEILVQVTWLDLTKTTSLSGKMKLTDNINKT